jgi:hypothetical protein
MRQPRLAEAEIPKARFVGALWTVAMCEKDWQDFCAAPSNANERLTVVLEHFCEHGADNLPGASLRWLTPVAGDPASAHQGAFEARGVVLRGRRAPNGAGGMFFVTEIVVDAPPAGPTTRHRRNADDRQGFLPLGSVGDGERN